MHMISPPYLVPARIASIGEKPSIVDEGLDVLGVGALRRPGEAVVAADADADAAPVHLLHRLDAHFELALVLHRQPASRA